MTTVQTVFWAIGVFATAYAVVRGINYLHRKYNNWKIKVDNESRFYND